MIFDTDDFHETNNRLDLLQQLKDANPLFRMTAFAVPAWCSDEFIASVPGWIELVPHGWNHGGEDCNDPLEAANWSYTTAMTALRGMPYGFAEGWKSPGWQISDGTYLALEELGWWVADQHYNDHRRPPGMKAHCEGDGYHVHTHVQNVCGNGLEETFPTLLMLVKDAESFELVSEVVK